MQGKFVCLLFKIDKFTGSNELLEKFYRHNIVSRAVSGESESTKRDY